MQRRMILQKIIICCLPRRNLFQVIRTDTQLLQIATWYRHSKFIWNSQICDYFHFQTNHILEYSSCNYFVCGVHRCLEQVGATLHKWTGRTNLAARHHSYRQCVTTGWDQQKSGQDEDRTRGWWSYVTARTWFSINQSDVFAIQKRSHW